MHDTDTDDTGEPGAPLPTITFPRDESADRGDTSTLGADGDELISDVFGEARQQRLRRLDLDRLDTLALALYVERHDDVSAQDAVAIAEDELSRCSRGRGRGTPDTLIEDHSDADGEHTEGAL
jgi:hypothetical protein